MKTSDITETRTFTPQKFKYSFEALEILEKEAPMALDQHMNGVNIYRGMNSKNQKYLYHGDSGDNRKSANTMNHYTLIMDILPNWSHMPKRSKSWICSTSNRTAKTFGLYFHAFPDNDVDIAFCDHSDFWWAFPTLDQLGIGNLRSLNDNLNNVLHEFYIKTPEQMKKAIQTFDRIGLEGWARENMASYEVFQKERENGRYFLFEDLVSQHGSLMKGLEYILDPTRNGIHVHKFSELTSRGIPADVECWFEGPAYFLSGAKYEDNKIIADRDEKT